MANDNLHLESKTADNSKAFVLVSPKKEHTLHKPKSKDQNLESLEKRLENIEKNLNLNTVDIEKKFTNLYNVIIALFSVIAIFIGVYFINLGSNSGFGNSSTLEQSTITIPKASNQENGKLILSKFAGNAAINDTGSKINVAQNKVTTIGHPNCQTPIIPPELNGCGFVIIPNLLGLPKKGIIFNSLQIFAKINGDSQIIINQRDYQKGITERQIAVVNALTLENPISLPSDLSNSDGLYFRLWDKGGEISISNIILNFSNIQDLNSVEGTLEADQSLYTKKATVYLDVNENSTFEPETDKPWIAKTNFAGVKTVDFDSQGKFKFIRDETSLKLERPKSWENDDFKYSLPAGKWLLVFEETGKSASFELTTKSEQVRIDLKI